MQDALRSLDAVPAPPELWDRVALARMEQCRAPAELWDRVQPAVAELARSGRIVPLRRTPRVSRQALAAAALLLAAGAGVLLLPPGSGFSAGEIQARHAERRAQFRERVVAVSVRPEELSPVARALAASLGAPSLERPL